jgi:hypothetical protein
MVHKSIGHLAHHFCRNTAVFRIHLTYNLYFSPVDGSSLRVVEGKKDNGESVLHIEQKFKSALSELLADPTFLPEGGNLGFGLLHQYPINRSTGNLANILSHLKGSDALIHRVCASMGLNVKPVIIYDADDQKVMTDRVVDLSNYKIEWLERVLCKRFDGVRIKSRGLLTKKYAPTKDDGEDSDDDRHSKFPSEEVW